MVEIKKPKDKEKETKVWNLVIIFNKYIGVVLDANI